MFDRAQKLDQNFSTCLKEQRFPAPQSTTNYQHCGLTANDAWDLFSVQCMSRLADLCVRELKRDQLSFYTIGSSGHEGNAGIAYASHSTDMAFLHYRSAAFYLARCQQAGYKHALTDLLRSFRTSRLDPISGGRHKVIGSVEYNMPPQTSTIASHLPKALGAAVSIIRAKELQHLGRLKEDSVVLCSFGDASVNHAVAQTTFNSASYLHSQGFPLPLVFICEDNGWGISVKTPSDWVKNSMSNRFGLTYISVDGLNVFDVVHKTQLALKLARETHHPVFLHMHCVRLLGHAGSDIEQVYRSEQDIEQTEHQDPLLHCARQLLESGDFDVEQLLSHYHELKHMVWSVAKEVAIEATLSCPQEVMSSLLPKPAEHQPVMDELRREQIFADQYSLLNQPRTMAQQINHALTDIMLEHPQTLVFGEDVAKKGGVYHVTADLVTRFGQRRVFDTLLDETMILGMAIGFSHNGFLPIPEIQFLAYYHNAEDQIRSEAATLSFFSNQQYTNPMVIRIAGYAYQQGFGGHFHNDNSIAALRDLPGVVIASPSRPDQAARLLRECVRLAIAEQRVVFFIEPIALYNRKDGLTAGDHAWLAPYPSPEQRARFLGVDAQPQTAEHVIVSYANGYHLAWQAQQHLKMLGIEVRLIDLQWLNPLPIESLIEQLGGVKSVLIVDECRQTGSVSEALVTALYERLSPLPLLKRLCAKDSFIPLGPAATCVLPSCDDIVNIIKQLANGVAHE